MLAYLFRYRHELPLFLDHLAVPQANVRQHRVAAQPVKVGFFLVTKTVRCCLPLPFSTQYYSVVDIKIRVFNKLDPGNDLRCYQFDSATFTGVSCNPNTPCVSEGE
jgi:hypothetical protein